MKSIKNLFIGISAYVFLYGLACTLILIYAGSTASRLMLLALLTGGVLVKAVWMISNHADELQAWGRKHIH